MNSLTFEREFNLSSIAVSEFNVLFVLKKNKERANEKKSAECFVVWDMKDEVFCAAARSKELN